MDPYRLPTTVLPSRYDIRLEPDLAAASFAGQVVISLDVRAPVTEVVLNAETPEPTQAEGTLAPEQTSPPETAATDTPVETTNDATAQTSGGGTFTEGQTVVTNDEVRMRSEHSTASDENVLEDLPAGVALTILSSEPFEDANYVWWNVRDEASIS